MGVWGDAGPPLQQGGVPLPQDTPVVACIAVPWCQGPSPSSPGSAFRRRPSRVVQDGPYRVLTPAGEGASLAKGTVLASHWPERGHVTCFLLQAKCGKSHPCAVSTPTRFACWERRKDLIWGSQPGVCPCNIHATSEP